MRMRDRATVQTQLHYHRDMVREGEQIGVDMEEKKKKRGKRENKKKKKGGIFPPAPQNALARRASNSAGIAGKWGKGFWARREDGGARGKSSMERSPTGNR